MRSCYFTLDKIFSFLCFADNNFIILKNIVMVLYKQ
jgi:hypothetical protein